MMRAIVGLLTLAGPALVCWLANSQDRRSRLASAVEALPYQGRDRGRVTVYAGYGIAETQYRQGRI
jgi:hypothetical protein